MSGHGLGHATRTSALLAALRARAGGAGLAVTVVSDAPHWIFTERDPDVACRAAAIDAGMVQRNGLDVDVPATLAAHEALADAWDARVAEEAARLRALGAALVVGDVPPLAFAAARRAGVRAAAVGNFSWDWILEHYAASQPRFAPVVARYREAYAAADVVYRLPLHAPFPAFANVRDVPLLVRRARRPRADVRAEIGVPDGDDRRLVLVSFGGFGVGASPAPARGDLAGYRFVAFTPRPPGLDAEWTALPARSPIPHEELVAACDAVIGKPGYGTAAEVLAHGTPFLYLPRDDFPETPVLVRGLQALGCARPMPRADFEAGRWREHLAALFEAAAGPAGGEALRCDGADVIAEELLAGL